MPSSRQRGPRARSSPPPASPPAGPPPRPPLPRGSRVNVVDPPGLAGDRPDARDARVGRGRAEQREPVAGGGCVEDHEVERGPPVRRSSCARSQIFPIVTARHPGRGGGEQLEDAAAAEHARERAGAQLVAQPLLHRPPGIDREAVQIVLELDLGAPGRSRRTCREPLAARPPRRPPRACRAARRRAPSAAATVRLAGAALARDEDAAVCRERCHARPDLTLAWPP